MFPSPTFMLFISSQGADVAIHLILGLYAATLCILLVLASQSFFFLYLQHRSGAKSVPDVVSGDDHPVVTIQLPVYNELYVIDRLIHAVCRIDHPRESLEIQVLDDSTDETIGRVEMLVRHYQSRGYDIQHIVRDGRAGFKAGALQAGLQKARGEFIAIFDADFVPKQGFLSETLPHFRDASIGLVQTRWEHLNEEYSGLTRTQALAFDGHFTMDQDVRNKNGYFMSFNGTGGVWRKKTILDAGGWHADTLTEDLDLSYRAQLRGWKFKFLNDTTSPAELPADFNALRVQQNRWTKGYIQTARKILPKVWSSSVPLRVKILSTFHLAGNLGFPFVLIAGILNLPLALIKMDGGYDAYFGSLPVFVLALLGPFFFYMKSQRLMHTNWMRRMLYYPLFIAGSIGFSVSNTRAVFEGLRVSRNSFIRTPKYALEGVKDTWAEKNYTSLRLDRVVLIEILLGLYCFFGVVFSLYHLEFAAVPFQLMYASGFTLVSWLSVKHARNVRQSHKDDRI
jgi:cellulose synthase/poly-beta-1,6-N-acetylglucosamine synthase-like glycosyltransferase